MKISLLALCVTFHALAEAAEIPDDLRREAEQIWDIVHPTRDASTTSDFFTTNAPLAEAYLERLARLGEKVSAAKLQVNLDERSNGAELILSLAGAYSESQPKVVELSNWYGRYRDQVPRALREKQFQAEIHSGLLDPRKLDSPSVPRSHVPRYEPLHEEHAKEDYRRAWEVWLLMPLSRERWVISHKIYEALGKIANPASLPFLLEAFRIETTLWAEEPGHKRSLAVRVMTPIRTIGGLAGLKALLECNRIAIAQGFVGTGMDSVSRNIVRMLTSRSLYADQNPNESGVTPGDDKWKEFRPLILSLLSEPDKLPPEDQRLLKEAMEAMPQR